MVILKYEWRGYYNQLENNNPIYHENAQHDNDHPNKRFTCKVEGDSRLFKKIQSVVLL